MRARLRALAAELVPSVEAEALAERLAAYGEIVQRYSRRLNLVGDRSDAFVAEQLIGGSLQLLRVARPSGRLVDVGSGAGVPGIPLWLACAGAGGEVPPGGALTEVVLVEVRQKKAAFLRRAIALLGLTGVRVHDGDVAEVTGPFDWAVARAFKAPAEWLRIGAQLVGEGGRIGVYTTATAWAEAVAAGALGGDTRLTVVGDATDPSGLGRRVIVVGVG